MCRSYRVDEDEDDATCPNTSGMKCTCFGSVNTFIRRTMRSTLPNSSLPNFSKMLPRRLNTFTPNSARRRGMKSYSNSSSEIIGMSSMSGACGNEGEAKPVLGVKSKTHNSIIIYLQVGVRRQVNNDKTQYRPHLGLCIHLMKFVVDQMHCIFA